MDSPIDRLKIPMEKPETSSYHLPTRGYVFGRHAPPQTWKGKWSRGIGNYLLWAVILTLLAFFVFYFIGWDYFQNANGDPAVVKIFIVSLLVALTIVILLAWFSII